MPYRIEVWRTEDDDISKRDGLLGIIVPVEHDADSTIPDWQAFLPSGKTHTEATLSGSLFSVIPIAEELFVADDDFDYYDKLITELVG